MEPRGVARTSTATMNVRGRASSVRSTTKNPTLTDTGKSVSGALWGARLVRIDGERKPTREFFRVARSLAITVRPVDLDSDGMTYVDDGQGRAVAVHCTIVSAADAAAGWYLCWGGPLVPSDLEDIRADNPAVREIRVPLSVRVPYLAAGAAPVNPTVEKRLREFVPDTLERTARREMRQWADAPDASADVKRVARRTTEHRPNAEADARAARRELNRIHPSNPDSPYHGEAEAVALAKAQRLVITTFPLDGRSADWIAARIEAAQRLILRGETHPTISDIEKNMLEQLEG